MATADGTRLREHYWDLIRGGLLLLGLPYHAALVYSPRSKWAVHSTDDSAVLEYLCGVLHSFRMPVFFLMAGYFSYMILRRQEPRAWLRSRLVRLGVPLFTAAILLNPVQMVAAAEANAINGLIAPDATGASVIYALTTLGNQWIRHLWFLQALIVYSGILALLYGLVRRAVEQPAVGSLPDRILGSVPLFLSVVIGGTAAWLVGTEALFWVLTRAGVEQPLEGMLNLELIMANTPFFAIGVIVQAAARANETLRGGRAPTAIAAVVLALLCGLLANQSSIPFKVAAAALTAAAAVMMARALISICARTMNRPNPHVMAIVDASFTIYLLHQPLISILGTAFLLVALPPVLEFAIIVVTTLLLAYAGHMLIRRSDLLLFALNGAKPKRSPREPAPRLTPGR